MVHPLSTVLSFPSNTIQNPGGAFSYIVQAVHDWTQDGEKFRTSDVSAHESYKTLVSLRSYSEYL